MGRNKRELKLAKRRLDIPNKEKRRQAHMNLIELKQKVDLKIRKALEVCEKAEDKGEIVRAIRTSAKGELYKLQGQPLDKHI